MAKFATALCILLLACGTQGSTESVMEETLEAYLVAIREKIEAAVEELKEGWEVASASYDDFVQQIEDSIAKAIAEFEAKQAELKANYDDISSCMKSNVNWTASAEAVLSDAIACAKNASYALLSEYESIKADFVALATEVNTTIASVKACVDADTTMLQQIACLTEIASSTDYTAFATKLAALVADVKELYSSLENFGDTLKSCAIDSALTELKSQWDTYLTEVEECLAAASATTVST